MRFSRESHISSVFFQGSLLCLEKGGCDSGQKRQNALEMRVIFLTIRAGNLGIGIETSSCTKCIARNVIRFKQQLNKNNLFS